MGISTAGVNGAFVAPNNSQTTGNGPSTDVGSPGIAVAPEPASIALFGLGGLMFARRRKI